MASHTPAPPLRRTPRPRPRSCLRGWREASPAASQRTCPSASSPGSMGGTGPRNRKRRMRPPWVRGRRR
eukprot:15364411-Alexandrium_andersonii.AAC.1